MWLTSSVKWFWWQFFKNKVEFEYPLSEVTNFKEIDERILKGVDYIVNLPNESVSKLPSSIVTINNKGEIKKLR